jgi:hypothetical protein
MNREHESKISECKTHADDVNLLQRKKKSERALIIIISINTHIYLCKPQIPGRTTQTALNWLHVRGCESEERWKE